eukprot:ANDGO_05992.mRNA.1 Vacuolar protein sorting-associated protein 18 homolog
MSILLDFESTSTPVRQTPFRGDDRSDDEDDYYDSGNSFNRTPHSGAIASSERDTEGENDVLQFQVIPFDFDEDIQQYDGIRSMAIGNEILVIGTNKCRIFYYDLESSSPSFYDIPRKGTESVHRVFVDPTGHHVLVSLNNGDAYYIHPSASKPRKMDKLKDRMLFESVAFDRRNTDPTSSGAVLIGGDNGCLYEARFDSKEGVKSFRMVYDLKEKSGGEQRPITGCAFEVFGGTQGSIKQMFILVSTQSRLYEFVGGPSFDEVFQLYQGAPSFVELPGTPTTGDLCLFTRLSASRTGVSNLPQSFAWRTGAGVFHGQLFFSTQLKKDSITSDCGLYPYDPSSANQIPVSIEITEFHIFVLYENLLQVFVNPPGKDPSRMSLDVEALRSRLVFEHRFEKPREIGVPIGLLRDPSTNNLWLFTEKSIFEVSIRDEARNVWKVYLLRATDSRNPAPENFEMALKYCADDPEKRDIVNIARADHYFDHLKSYDQAAAIYASTGLPFEEVALKFVDVGQKSALKTFLFKKLDSLHPEQQLTQLACLSTWLVEIFLDEMNQLRENNTDGGKSFQSCVQDFEKFLEDYRRFLNKSTTFNLIMSHGFLDQLIFFATIIGDFDKVVSHYLSYGAYAKALKVLSTQCLSPDLEHLFYKFGPTVIQKHPKQLVDIFIRAGFLKPAKVIPVLLRYDAFSMNEDGDYENHAIRYLEHVVTKMKNKDTAVHNYLCSLYVKSGDDNKLISFVNPRSGERYFDTKYVLRLCIEEKKLIPTVHLYLAMGHFDEAVETALKANDVEFAKVCANSAEDDETLRRKLWMRIACYVVEEKQNIKQAMELIHECRILRIEDVLPFFPDFALIDDFKEEICKSLEEYNAEIASLKEEMNDSMHLAEQIRADIRELRNRHGYVSLQQKCGFSHQPLNGRPFYLFPCGHAFLEEVLVREVALRLTKTQRAKVQVLLDALSRLDSAPQQQAQTKEVGNVDKFSRVEESERDRVKRELDDVVAGECPLCGEMMIRLVDKPFVSLDETSVEASWRIT